MWNRSRVKWTALTFGPAIFILIVAGSFFAQGQPTDGVTMLIFAAAAVFMGHTNLSSYRAGYWRGQVEQHDDAAKVRIIASDWQPSPWDDNRW